MRQDLGLRGVVAHRSHNIQEKPDCPARIAMFERNIHRLVPNFGVAQRRILAHRQAVAQLVGSAKERK